MIVNYSDLTGLLQIPMDNVAMQSIIDSLSEDCEAVVLEHLLGTNEYNLYLENESDYTELIEGKADLFDYNGINNKWGGVKNMLKYYIYYSHLTENTAITTEVGSIRGGNSGEYVNNLDLTMKIYNKFVAEFNKGLNYINYVKQTSTTLYLQTNTSKLLEMNCFGI